MMRNVEWLRLVQLMTIASDRISRVSPHKSMMPKWLLVCKRRARDACVSAFHNEVGKHPREQVGLDAPWAKKWASARHGSPSLQQARATTKSQVRVRLRIVPPYRVPLGHDAQRRRTGPRPTCKSGYKPEAWGREQQPVKCRRWAGVDTTYSSTHHQT